jgi:transmembrane sensor
MDFYFRRIATLILKNLRDELTDEERQKLQTWVNSSPENKKLYAELTNEESLRMALQEFYESDENIWNKILQRVEVEKTAAPVRKIRPWRYVTAASVAILIAAGAFWWYNKSSSNIIAKVTPTPAAVKLEDIKPPSGNNSTLTLGDGSIIILDSTGNGTLARQGNSTVFKNEGVLQYSFSENIAKNNTLPAFNTLRTKRGGQQKVLLPDGSAITLNTESTITYPTFFASNERRVKISGEVAFEIKSIPSEDSQDKLPFIVEIFSSDGKYLGEVEVLGTHFAINAYDDEAVVKTTLAEGSVSMHNKDQQSIKLVPGQQAQLSATGNLKIIKDADVEAALAFTKNEFLFRGADVETIFREVCRWYPISVSYPNGKPKDKLTGTISRNLDLAQLLSIFSDSEIKFKLEDGNKLIVTP